MNIRICGFTLIFLTTFAAQSSAFAYCYSWENDSDRRVVLRFEYLDTNFSPTGQVNSIGLDAGRTYPSAGCNNFGLNSYAHVRVINGKAGWDEDSVIFGTEPSDGTYYIVGSKDKAKDKAKAKAK